MGFWKWLYTTILKHNIVKAFVISSFMFIISADILRYVLNQTVIKSLGVGSVVWISSYLLLNAYFFYLTEVSPYVIK